MCLELFLIASRRIWVILCHSEVSSRFSVALEAFLMVLSPSERFFKNLRRSFDVMDCSEDFWEFLVWSEQFRKFPEESEALSYLWEIFELLRVFLKHSHGFWVFVEGFWTFWSVLKYSGVVWGFLEHLKAFSWVLSCSRRFWRILRWSAFFWSCSEVLS